MTDQAATIDMIVSVLGGMLCGGSLVLVTAWLVGRSR